MAKYLRWKFRMYLHRIKFSVTIKDLFFPKTAVWMETQIVVSQKFCETATCDFWDSVVPASSQCESAAKSSFEFHFLHYLVVYEMLLDDFSVSCKQRLLTLQFENELDGACYSLLAALLLVWSPCCRIFKFNAVYIFIFFNR